MPVNLTNQLLIIFIIYFISTVMIFFLVWKKQNRLTNKTLEFLALNWENKHWDFGSPTVLLKPLLSYDGDTNCDSLIEDTAIDIATNPNLAIKEIYTKKDFESEVGITLKRLKAVANKLIDGDRGIWGTKLIECVYQKINFTWNEKDELYDFDVIDEERITIDDMEI